MSSENLEAEVGKVAADRVSAAVLTRAATVSLSVDKAVVRVALRNCLSKAIAYMGGREPDDATARDMLFEDKMWTLIEQEFSKDNTDYSGGKTEKAVPSANG